MVDKGRLRLDNGADDLARAFDYRNVDSWLGSRNRHVADCL